MSTTHPSFKSFQAGRDRSPRINTNQRDQTDVPILFIPSINVPVLVYGRLFGPPKEEDVLAVLLMRIKQLMARLARPGLHIRR